MSDHDDPFPPLPTETIITIIEVAATQRATALNLCLVSKTVYNLVKPIFYHSVQVQRYNYTRFHRWFFTYSPIDPNKHHRSLIRDLTVECRVSSYLLHVVNICDRLDRLVCSADIVDCTRTESRPRELVVSESNDTSALYGGDVPPGDFSESVTHLYVNSPVLGPTFVETVNGMKSVKYLGVSLTATSDPREQERIAEGILGLLDIRRLAGIFVYDRSTAVADIWRRLAKVSDRRLVVAVQAVVDWDVDPASAAYSGVSPWEKMKGLEGWRKDIENT